MRLNLGDFIMRDTKDLLIDKIRGVQNDLNTLCDHEPLNDVVSDFGSDTSFFIKKITPCYYELYVYSQSSIDRYFKRSGWRKNLNIHSGRLVINYGSKDICVVETMDNLNDFVSTVYEMSGSFLSEETTMMFCRWVELINMFEPDPLMFTSLTKGLLNSKFNDRNKTAVPNDIIKISNCIQSVFDIHDIKNFMGGSRMLGINTKVSDVDIFVCSNHGSYIDTIHKYLINMGLTELNKDYDATNGYEKFESLYEHKDNGVHIIVTSNPHNYIRMYKDHVELAEFIHNNLDIKELIMKSKRSCIEKGIKLRGTRIFEHLLIIVNRIRSYGVKESKNPDRLV